MFEIAIELCPFCENEIYNYGMPAMEAWAEIIFKQIRGYDNTLYGGSLGTGKSTIRFLEQKGFIITTETGASWLKVKALGVTEAEERYIICKDKINHRFEE
jgi:hypothetical protein